MQKREGEGDERASRCAATNLSVFIFVRSQSRCVTRTQPSFSSTTTFSALRRQLFNSGRSPTNDARGIYDPVNSFYSTVKSA